MSRTRILLISLFAFVCMGTATAGIKVKDLKTEMLTNPVGIDRQQPRLSWLTESADRGVVQSAYRILVATSADLLSPKKADLWDSGLRKSNQQAYIAYGGKKLLSGQRCFWRVQVQTNHGSAWSDVASWQTALMDSADFRGQWIGGEFPTDKYQNLKGTNRTQVAARYLRKEFRAEAQPTRATLYISGLGLYEAWVNGQRIGESEMAPGPTDYDFRVFYNTYDVTPQLQAGQNAIGVILGNGRWLALRNPGVKQYGTPVLRAMLVLTYADGHKQSISTDETWKITANGPVGYNNEYDGEDYNGLREMPGWDKAGFDDRAWYGVAIEPGPKGKLVAQPNPNIKVMEEIKPVGIKELRPGVYILDMGQNMVGRLSVRLQAQRGDSLRMQFAETLQPDGSLYLANLRTALCTDHYIASGQGTELWQPKFIYHGFRYVELQGFRTKPELSDFTGQVLYDDMPVAGTFECSSDVINRVYRNAYWGIRGNYRGMPTDCPQRDERMGWLGDRATGCIGESYIFNNHLLYAKWLQDIADDQKPNGGLTDVAPIYWDVFGDDVTWPSAFFLGTNMVYEQFGDVQPIRTHYATMKRYMQHIHQDKSDGYIVNHDTYGDWCMPPEKPELIHSKDPSRITSGKLMSTAFYYMMSGLMKKFATLSGNTADTSYWQQEMDATRKAFNDTFWNQDKGCYDNNTVTANILPLRFGMAPKGQEERIVKNIIEKTENDFSGHVSTGVIGIQQLMRGLTDFGHGDLALKIATNRTYPSWGYMADHGATTIWELWNGDTADPAMNSGNHVMLLGDFVIWLYNYLAGIGQTPESAGYKHIVLKPRPIGGLDHVSASYNTIYGKISSAWKKSGSRFSWDFTIPANTTARVYIPVSGSSLSAATQKSLLKMKARPAGKEKGYAIYDFPSGSYSVVAE